MEKMTLTIMELINTRNALGNLLEQTGLKTKTSYWLDRNGKFIVAAINKKWPEASYDVFKKFAVEDALGVKSVPLENVQLSLIHI